jgi:hypothetical protein
MKQISNIKPSNPVEGDQYYEPSTGEIYCFSQNQWLKLSLNMGDQGEPTTTSEIISEELSVAIRTFIVLTAPSCSKKECVHRITQIFSVTPATAYTVITRLNQTHNVQFKPDLGVGLYQQLNKGFKAVYQPDAFSLNNFAKAIEDSLIWGDAAKVHP